MRKTCARGWSMQFFVRHFAENGSCGLKFQHPLSFLVPNMMRMLIKIQLAFFWHEIVIASYEATDSAFRWLVWLGTQNLVHQFLSYLTEGMHGASFWKFCGWKAHLFDNEQNNMQEFPVHRALCHWNVSKGQPICSLPVIFNASTNFFTKNIFKILKKMQGTLNSVHRGAEMPIFFCDRERHSKAVVKFGNSKNLVDTGSKYKKLWIICTELIKSRFWFCCD